MQLAAINAFPAHRRATQLQFASVALRVVAVFFMTTSTIVLTGTPARAHTQLVGSDPRNGALLDRVPRSLTLRFNEPIAPGFVTVVAQAGATALGELRVRAGDDPRELVVTVPEGARTTGAGAAAWSVRFRVASEDGHPVVGQVSFAVRASQDARPTQASPPSGVPVAGAAPAAPGLDRPPTDSGGATFLVTVLAALAVALAVAGTVRVRRRSAGDQL